MSDWQVGDLALCIKLGPWRALISESESIPYKSKEIRPGGVYEVIHVAPSDAVGLCLGFSVTVNPYAARNFVKVTPPEADDFDRETLTLEQTA